MKPRYIVFTDLDGTLIDFETYSISTTRPLVQALRDAGIPVVFCSSKTFAEQQSLQEAYGIEMPCIVENGSAIAAPVSFWRAPPEGLVEREGWLWMDLGMPAAEVRRRIRKIECSIGESLFGFSALATEDVATWTGLDLVSARRAQTRDFSETLAVQKPPSFWSEVEGLFAQQELHCLSGGRFRTAVSACCDKGKAVKAFMQALAVDTGGADCLSISIGDSPNDRDLLTATDVSYQVMTPDRSWSDIGAEDVVKVGEIGPRGWVKAIGPLLGAEGMPSRLAR